MCFYESFRDVTTTCKLIDSKSPAFGWRLQLSDSVSGSPAEQAKSPAKLGLTNFVKHVSHKLLFHKRKTVHDLRNREIDEKSAANCHCNMVKCVIKSPQNAGKVI